MSLSPDTIDRINKLRNPEGLYRPNETVRRHIGERILLQVAGPSSMGKNSVGEFAAEINNIYGMATTLTTREQRPSDKPGQHRFLEHNDENINILAGKILSGELVNYKFHPTTDMFYGSEVQDFPYDNNIMAVLSGAIDQFQAAGFKDTTVFGLVSPPDDWLKRFNTRYPLRHPERRGRVAEAEISYNDLLMRTDVHWVINYDGSPVAAAHEIVYPGEIKPDAQAEAIAMARGVLQLIDDEKTRAFGEKYE